MTLTDLRDFVQRQAPYIPTPPLTPSVTIVAAQLGNVYLLLAMLAVVCCYATNDPKVARNYLLVVAIADLGHVYSTYAGLGWDRFVDIGSWNDMIWGNVGSSIFLCINRVATLLGVFGSIKTGKKGRKLW